MCRIDKRFCISQVEKWVQHYGAWAIGGLALQPVLPFDIAGVVAGAARMPVLKFFLALLAGKAVKYVVLAYFRGGRVPDTLPEPEIAPKYVALRIYSQGLRGLVYPYAGGRV